MPPKKDPVSQLASEESAVNSPVRRSSRLSINAANSAAPAPAPATLRGRRASQTDATTTAKVTKSRRLSQAVDDKDSKEIEVKPAARGRRASLLVEETKQVASPRKNARTTRAVSKSPPTVKEVVKRGRKLSTASDTTETKEEPKTTRAKILATEDAAKTPVKATRGRRSSVSKVEEDEKEPSKVTTRGRRSSVTKEKEDTIVEEPKRVTRGRRSSVDNAEEVPPKPVGRRRKSIADEEISDAPAKSTPIKGRRRPSVTESLSNMDPIIENEENSEKSTIKLTPIKKKVEQAILDPNLSIISENEDTDSPRKLIFQKSAESTDLSEIKTPDKKSPKKLLAEEPRKHSDTDTIVSGTDGSFVFNLNVSIPNSDKTDLNLSEKADLNTSKCSNGSDKENESCKNTPGKKSISADLKESPVVKLQDIMMAANKDQITKSSSIIDPLKEKNVEEREKSMSEDFEFDMPSDNDEAELKMAEKNGEKERPKSPIIQSTRLSSSRRQSVGKTTENNTSIKEKSGRSPSPAREPPGKVVRRSLTHTSPHKMEEVEPMEVDDVFEEQVETDEPNTTTHSINKETNKSSAAFSEGDTFCDMSKLVVEESDLEDGSNLTEEEEEKLLKDPEENDALLAKDHKKSSNVDEKLNEDTINPIKEIKENELNKSASSTENEDQITEHKPNTSLNKTEETTQMDVENEIIEENNQTENNSSNLEETDASFKPRVSIGKEISGKNEERKSRSSLNVSNLLTEKQEIKIKEDQKEYESNTLSKSRLSVNANEEEAVHEKRRSRKISPNAREFKDELVRENRKSRNSLNISKMLPNEVITNGVTEVYNVSTKIENDEVVNLNESKKVAVENKKVSESEENADQDKSEIKNNGLYKNHDEVPCDNQKSEEKFDTSTKSSQNINLEKPENEDKTTENGLDDSHEELSDNVSSLSSESPSSKSKESEKKINISTKSRVGIYLDEPENEEKYLNDQRKPIKILNNLKSNSSEEVSDDNEDESTSFKINESEDPKENEIKSTKEFNKNGLDESRDISADEIDLNESKSLGNKFTEEISENEEEPKVNGLDASLEEIVDKQISPEKRKSKSRNSLNTSKLSFKNEEEPKVNGLDDNQGEDKPQPRSPEKQNKKSRNNLNTSKLSSKNKEKRENLGTV
ncbi:unnamed protein product [Brassicogethes aeneus]|uniref:Uncharacterized protein n=1 Tax=Brassicogethes aeneus TaxID=1431903 RepID=A0A9P0AYU4_BRAAE|nr:unnamed protein product [Brassicogethes aeneus]